MWSCLLRISHTIFWWKHLNDEVQFVSSTGGFLVQLFGRSTRIMHTSGVKIETIIVPDSQKRCWLMLAEKSELHFQCSSAWLIIHYYVATLLNVLCFGNHVSERTHLVSPFNYRQNRIQVRAVASVYQSRDRDRRELALVSSLIKWHAETGNEACNTRRRRSSLVFSVALPPLRRCVRSNHPV